jgi:hypothetical protein
MIHDLIERMIRKVQSRASWQECRCHPFLWSTGTRKRFLIEFADARNFSGPTKESVDLFMASLEQYGIYVFDKVCVVEFFFVCFSPFNAINFVTCRLVGYLK